jgi:hypothetical protein
MAIQTGKLNRGGRPPQRTFGYHRVGPYPSHVGTVAEAIDMLISEQVPILFNARLSDRRRLRAAIVTTARRRGVKVQTQWMHDQSASPSMPRSGRLYVLQVH